MKQILRIYIQRTIDDDADTSALDWRRIIDYNHSRFNFISIKAVAEVLFTEPGPQQTIVSGGVKNVEDDWNPDLISEYEEAQYLELIGQLRAMGFQNGEIDKFVPEELRA